MNDWMGGCILSYFLPFLPLSFQLASTESMKIRIKKGAAPVVSMLSPWCGSDIARPPPLPVWPKGLRDFVRVGKSHQRRSKAAIAAAAAAAAAAAEGAAAGTGASAEQQDEEVHGEQGAVPENFPPYTRVAAPVVDVSGSRLTTDGRRQICYGLKSDVPCPIFCNCARQV